MTAVTATPPTATAPPLVTWALGYARRGWPVAPLHGIEAGRCTCGRPHCSSPGKHPRTARGILEATADEGQIRQWWARWPRGNIGMATGATSRVDVLDVDGEVGAESLEDLVAEHGPLPATPEVLTGGGGRHLWFVHAEGLRCSAGCLGPGLDVRGDGGYVVAPPSLHVSGRRYLFEASSEPRDTPVADWPPWLLALVREPTGAAGNGRTPPAEWAGVAGGVPEGGRNEALARVVGHLLRRHVDPYLAHGLAHAWAARCRPPMEVEEVDRTVASVARRERRRREGHQ